jgi:hypothetical protein
VSTFWIVLANHLKIKSLICSMVVAREGSTLVFFLWKHTFSCRYSMSRTLFNDICISIKNIYKFFLVKSLGRGKPFSFHKPGQSNMTISIYKTRSITHDHLQFLGSTLQVLRTIPMPRKYPPSTPSDTFSIFWKHFIKPKLTLGNVVIFPTVHDRGLGYSNRFTLCRGCTLYPQHPDTHRVGIFPA